jgi:multiple sugar transport system ATP-binding protein
MAAVELRRVVKSFGATRVIHDLDLAVRNGDFVVFVGPSGCGKSTLLRMIAGLESVTEGEISIGNRVVNHLPPRERDIAMVFQDYALYPHKSVYENICFGLRLRRMPQAEIDARVKEAAEILRIGHLLDRLPRALSGGQRQRVAMGRAIVRQPQLFLFDEPLSNLDALLRHEMRTEIKKLHRRLEATSVYVTHDQVEAMTLADRIVVLSGGHLMQVGTPDDIYHRPANRFVAGFTGSPPMNFLRARVARRNGSAMLHIGTADEAIALPARWHALGASLEGRDVELGIRPEDVGPDLAGPDVAEIGSRVIVTEPLGAENLVVLSTQGGELTGRFAPTVAPRADEALRLRLDLGRMHLFDPQSGQALRP